MPSIIRKVDGVEVATVDRIFIDNKLKIDGSLFTRDELDLACRHAVDDFKRSNILFTAKELQEACAASARQALDQVSKSTPLPQLVVFQPVEQTGDPSEPKESRLDWAKKRTEPVARVCPWISVGYDDQTDPP